MAGARATKPPADPAGRIQREFFNGLVSIFCQPEVVMSASFVGRCLPMVLLVLGACHQEPEPAGTAQPLGAQVLECRDEIQGLVFRPWLTERLVLDLSQRLARARGVLDQLATTPEKERAEAWERAAEREVALYRDEFQPAVRQLLQASPYLDRIHAVAVRVDAQLGRLKVPDSEPFPFRNRWQEDWVRERNDQLALLLQGISAQAAGEKDDGKIMIALRNFPRIAQEGEERHAELELLTRPLDIVQGKIVDVNRHMDVLRAFQEKIPAGEDALRAKLEGTLQEIVAKTQDWQQRVRQYISDVINHRDPDSKLESELDVALLNMVRVGGSVAQDLGLPAPDFSAP